MVTIAAVAVVLGLMTSNAQAQRQYLDAFKAKYTKISADDAKKGCAICHGTENKKQRSDYAQALGKALGATKVKEVEKINAALTEVEGKEYEDGKTYGSLLNEGKLPAPFKN
jgi:cytochrome c553